MKGILLVILVTVALAITACDTGNGQELLDTWAAWNWVKTMNERNSRCSVSDMQCNGTSVERCEMDYDPATDEVVYYWKLIEDCVSPEVCTETIDPHKMPVAECR